MKAFLTQVDLAQSTNLPNVVCKGNIDKYNANPVNNTKCALPDNSFANAASRTTKNPSLRQGDDTKREPAATLDGNTKATANQRSKKARWVGVADSDKRSVSDMGMLFLTKLDTKASDIFPNNMSEAVCVNFTCKGKECLRDNCTFLHPRKVNNLKKDTILLAIAKHFHETKVGWFNEWHFLKGMGNLPEHAKNLIGGKDGPSSKTDQSVSLLVFMHGNYWDTSVFFHALILLWRPSFARLFRPWRTSVTDRVGLSVSSN